MNNQHTTTFDAVMLRKEFLSLPDTRLAEWELVLVDEINNGPRQFVRLTMRELDILRSVMVSRGLVS